MKASGIRQELIDNYNLRLPVFIWGSPGIGKSALIRQVADYLKIGFVDLRVASMDPVDLSGLPSVDPKTRRSYWNVPDMLPQAERDGEKGYLLLDELTSAVPMMQTVCYRLVQEGKVGEYTLPPGWTVVAAGNLATDNAVTYRQSSALASRFAHYDMDVDVEEWCDWGLKTGLIDTDVIAFIKTRPELLHKMVIKEEEHSFPTPRTWEYVSRHMPNVNPVNGYEKVRAFIGGATSIEFNAFMKIVGGLPTIDEILQNPKTARVAEDPAICNATVSLLTRHVTPQNFAKMMTYGDRMGAEFQATFTHDAVTQDEELAGSPEFLKWAALNAPRLRD